MNKLFLRWGKTCLTALVLASWGASLSVSLSACGGGEGSAPPPPITPTYTVGGTVAGLGAGKTQQLRNGSETLTVNTAGAFTFATSYLNNTPYTVTVATAPVGQSCIVTNGSGTINGANVTNVNVSCSNLPALTYTVGGTVTGLGSGKTLVLKNNGANNLSVGANGAFTFTTPLANGAAYLVQVQTQPAGQSCVVSNGSGAISGANVTNVGVACANVAATAWDHFTLGTNAAGQATLTLFSNEPLLVNSPFYGLEVRKNDQDITDDIINIEALTATSWRYTFGTEVLNTSGATIKVSLKNADVAAPGHYVAARGFGSASNAQGTYQLLVDCQAGVGECAGKGAMPGLLAAVKGISVRYAPRDIETRALTATKSDYDFSAIFNDAAFMASKGKKLHVIFTVKSFASNTLYAGNGTQVAFNIPRSADGQGGWNGDRTREVHVYVKNAAGAWNEVPFTFNAARTQAILSTAPPAPTSGTTNVNVVYARDPFPEYIWQTTPPLAGWYQGAGGANNDSGAGGGNHGHVYAPWRTGAVTWLREFMAAFEKKWTDAIAAGTVPADAIESVSIQETANALGDPGQSTYDPTYTVAGYRAGLLEFAKATARAVRRRAMFGLMFNAIPQGNSVNAMPGLATDIILWGSRLEGPDLFNNNSPGLEDNVYKNVHRAFHDKALTMIWHQNASYAENVGASTTQFYTPAQQFIKAQRGVTDTSTPSGTPGIEAEYVFWNLTTKAPKNSPLNFLDALPVMAANPVIQTTGNDRHLWRRSADGLPIGDQSVSVTNP